MKEPSYPARARDVCASRHPNRRRTVLLICAALGEEKTEVVCDGISADIAATAKCLSALGAKIEEMETGFLVSPIKKVPEGRCDLYCGESGSTLRFLLPIVARARRAGGIPPRGAAAPAPARPAG